MKRFLFIIAILLAMYPVKGQQKIVAGEYFLDKDPGEGRGTHFVLSSKTLDSTLNLNVPVDTIPAGYHILNFRFVDAVGHWGMSFARSFYVRPAPVALPNIVYGEYFIDNEPGVGLGTPVNVPGPGVTVTLNLQVSVNSLTPGQHSLTYRFLDAAGRWGEDASQLFYVQPAPTSLTNIVYGEYYFDADPGFGNGTSITLTPGLSVTSSFSIPAINIPTGYHNLQIRYKDQAGRWSASESRMFVKVQTDTISNIVRGEYFFDSDPGVGNGVQISIGSPSANVTFNPSIPIGGLSVNNFHTLYYRFETISGKWGLTGNQNFYLTDNKEKYYTPVNKIEVYADNNSDSARTRIDSVGIVMNGYKATGQFTMTNADALTQVGRHFLWARAIDYFGHNGPKYSPGEFVVTSNINKGMLLGIARNPDSTIMTSGSVEIYKDSSGVITLFKTVVPDNTGNFLIGDITEGSYLFLLKPNVAVSPTAINTYYDQQPQWQMANFQNINVDTMFADVDIRALKTKNLNGLTCISGYVSQGTKSNGISISPERLTGRPMKGASVVLVGKSSKGAPSTPSNVVALVVSDDTGYYSICNVPAGDYNILIDILGVPLIDYYTINIDTSAKEKPNLNYVVGTAGISILSVGTPKTNNTLVYPNPSSGEINILFGNQAGRTNITIVDLAGKTVFKRNLEVISNSVSTLDLHSLEKGLYNMIIAHGNSMEVKKIILQ